MIVEINKTSFNFADKTMWETKLGEIAGKRSYNVVAHRKDRGIFFQLFWDRGSVELLAQEDDYELQFGVSELAVAQMVELIDPYFTEHNKFEKYFPWKRSDHGLTEAQRKFYKRFTYNQFRLVAFGAMLLGMGCFYSGLNPSGRLPLAARIASVPGSLLAAIALFICWRWEVLHDKRLHIVTWTSNSFKTLMISGMFLFGAFITCVKLIHPAPFR